MNKIYRVIWNSATANWVVVSEIAKTVAAKSRSVCVSGTRSAAGRVGSGSFTLTDLATALCFAGLLLSSTPAMAAKVGGLNVGDGPGVGIWPSHVECKPATTKEILGVAIGCEAYAEGVGLSTLDRKNPYEQRDDMPADKKLTKAHAVAVGNSAKTSQGAVALGGYANAAGMASLAAGAHALSVGGSSVALGNRANSRGNTSIAIGRQSTANGDFSLAMGNVSAAVGKKSVAIGHSATALGEQAIAIGSPDTETEKAVYYQGQSRTLAEGAGSISLGTRAATTSAAVNSLAIGTGTKVSTDSGVAIGRDAKVTRTNAVALGSASNTDKGATSVNQATVGGKTYSGFAGVSKDSNLVVSVGAAGNERQIKNVASGEISASSTDAINGSQLYAALNQATAASGSWKLQTNGDAASTIASGGTVQFLDGANIDITRNGNDVRIATSPALTADSLTINKGGPVLNGSGLAMGNKKITGVANGTSPNDAVNVSQLGAVKTIADSAKTEAAKGWNLRANGDTASKVAPGGTVEFLDGANIDITRNGNNVTIATSPALTADSLTINKGGPVLNASGIKMGGKKITGLANGTEPNDAVNFSQLGAVKTVADNALVEASKGWNLQANGDTASKLAPGNKVQFLDGTNINITRNGNDITVATKADLTADSLTINNGGPVLSSNGVNMRDKKLTNVAPGTLSAESKDGVNASQLFAVGNSTAKTLGGDSKFDPETGVVTAALKLDDGKQTFDNVNDALNAVFSRQASQGFNLQANGDTASKVAPGDTVQFLDGTNINVTRKGNDITIATAADLTADSLTINNGGPVLNADGIKMGGKKITGLADGTEPNDAVNFSQLSGVKTVADNALTEASKGWNLQANGDTASKVAPGDTVQFLDGTNINITRNGNDITVATKPDLTADSLTINNGGPVLSKDGINMSDKKLTNVAPGTLSAASKDGVNGSQLFAVGNSTASSLGGDSKFDPETGVVTAALKLEEGNQTFDNVNDALNAVNGQASKGFNLQANGDTASKVAPGDTVQFLDGTNINVTRNGNDITVATAADLKADSLTINNGGPVLNADGIAMGGKKITGLADGTDANDAVNFSQLSGVKTVADNALTEASKGWNLQLNDEGASKVAPGDTVKLANGSNISITKDGDAVSIATTPDLTADSLTINNGGPVLSKDGINMSDKKLTNVAPGTLSAASKDGVNGSQLFAVGNSTASTLGGDSKFDPDTGVVTAELKLEEGNQTFDNVNDALNAVNGQASKGFNLQANGDTASKVAPGDTVQFLDGTNINVTRKGNDITIATAADLTADSLTINNGGPVLNADGIAMGGKKITGLADGTKANDAVNFSQLGAVKTVADNALVEASKGWNLQANGDTASKVAPGDTVQFLDGTNIAVTRNGNDITVATKGDLTADSLTINNGGPVLSKDGINMSDKKLTNVAPGTLSAASKDGVNGSQLFAVGNSTASSLGGDSKFDPDTGVVTAALKLEEGNQTFDNVNDALNAVNGQASKGFNLQANGDTASKVAPGDTVQFLDGTNINVTRKGNDITIATAADLKADSLTINNGGPVLNADGIAMGGKKITGLADGTDANDAVNFSQLSGVKTVADNALTEASKGWNLQLNDEAASKVSPGDTVKLANGSNISITKDGDAVSIATTPDLTADSLTINNGGPVLSKDGINMSDKKLTNVAPGSLSAESKDGVNGSQLFAVGNSTASSLGGDSKFDPDTGVVTAALKLEEGNQTFDNVNDALNAVNGQASKGFNLQANGDTASKVAPGDTVQFLDGTNINVTRNGNDITVATAADLTADSLTINNGGPVLNADGIAMGGKKVTGLADGTDANDAVNFSQLSGVKTVADNALTEASKGWNLQLNDEGASKVSPGDTVKLANGSNISITKDGDAVSIATTPDLTADSLTINNGGPVLSKDGINMSDKKLTNVAPGSLSAESKDGVNGSQLFAVGNSTASTLGGDSKFDPETGVVSASLKVGDNSFTNVNDALGDLHNTLAETTAEAGKGWNLQANGDTASKVAPGDTVQFLDGTNIAVTRNGNDITVATKADLTADSLTINNSGPVLSKDGINMSDKKLTNVAPGSLSAESKDGVNGSQLFAVGNSTASTLGGDSKFDPETGVVSASLKVGDNSFTNVNDALGDLHNTLAETTAEAGKGWSLQLNDEAASKVAPGDTVKLANGNNISITKDGDAVSIATTPDLTADSLTINNGGPVLNKDGINMSDKKLTNVAPGTLSAESKDGVNGSQLFAVGNSTASTLGGDSKFDPDTGVVTAALKLEEGNQTFDNVNDALNAVNGQASKGFNLQANGDTASKVAPGDTVQFLDGTNINVTRNGNDITVATAADLTADSLTINNGGPVLSKDGINMSDKKLTNVAPGSLSAESKDGVNGSQLFAVGNSTASSLGGDSKFDPETGVVSASLKVGDNTFTNVNDALGDLHNTLAETTAEAGKGWSLQANGDTASKVAPGDTVQFLDGTNINVTRKGNDITIATAADLTADSLTINNGGPVLNADGIKMGGKKITGLADGTEPNDAVNFSQLSGVKTVADNALTEASKGWNLQLNDEGASKVAPGDTVKLANGSNISITKDGDAVSIATTPDLTADSLTINNGGPVLSKDGINMSDTKLTNVAPGSLSAESKDGVNGSQLFAVGNSTASSLGGDSKFDPETGVVSASLKVGDNTFTNVNDALGDLHNTLAETTAEAGKGWSLQLNDEAASKVAPGDTVKLANGNNISITKDGDAVSIATTPDLTADSLTINNGGPVLSKDGINMSDKKLTNVAPGTLSAASKDGVNGSQLFAVGNSTASSLGGDSKFDPETGVVSASLKVGDNSFTNVNDALGDLHNTLAETTAEAGKGWNLQANGDTASKVAPGDTVQFLDGTNINVMRKGNDITIATAADLTADSLTINNGGPVLSKDGINMSDKKLTNVAPGTLSAESKDGVNGSQLFAVGNSTASSLGGDSKFDPETGVVSASLKVGDNTFTNVNDALGDLHNTLAETTAEAGKGWSLQLNDEAASKVAPGDTVKLANGNNISITKDGDAVSIATTPDLTADSLTINNGGPVLSKDGINMSDKKLTNVAPGTLSAASKDGVNGSQLFAVGNSTASTLGGDSKFDPETGVVSASLKVGDNTFTNVNDALGDLHNTLAETTAEAGKGWNLQANGDTASKVAPGDTVQFLDGTNINVTRKGNDITIATAADLTADSLTINNGGPVLSKDGINMSDKKLTNVAPGTLSAESKDGVNGSQLFAVGNSTASTLGGDSKFDPETGVVSASLKVGDNTFTNVNDALGDLHNTLAETTAEAGKGWNLQANGDTASKVAPGDTVQFLDGTNIAVTRNGNDITLATKADLTADSLTINNGGPVLNSTGIDMGGKKLTNVGAGILSAESKDGVNASQLFAVGNSTARALGGDSVFDPDTGSVVAGLKIDDQTYTNVNDALNAVNSNVGTIARRGWDIAGADGIVGTVGSGGQVQFVAGNAHTKVNVTQENGVAKVSVAAAASPLQYTQTANANGKNEPIADPFSKTNSVTLVGQDAAAPVSLNNVANATLSEDSLQAVNGSQLHGLGQSIASTLGGDTRFNAQTGKLETTFQVGDNSYNTVADALSGVGATASQGWQLQVNNDDPQKVAPGSIVGFKQGSNIQLTRDGNAVTIATVPNVTFESVTTGKLEGDTISAKSYLGVIDGPALTQSGIDAAGKRITNVQAGEIAEGSTDAVNGGQLHSLASGTASAINRLQGNLDRVEKNANAGSATAGAMANLPQAYLPGKSMFALATARYSGQQGFAAGLSKVSDNGNWIIKGSVSGNTRGKTMIGAGIGYQW